MTFNPSRQPEGIPTGGQFAATAHSDNVPALAGIPAAPVDPSVSPTTPWRPYVITEDEDGALHYDDVTADWEMQHKEPRTRSEIRQALSCPRLAGRQGRVVDLGFVTSRRNSTMDDDYDVVGPESGAPLVIRVNDGFHRLHVRSGNVQIEVKNGFGGGTTIHGGDVGVVVDGQNKYFVETHGQARARIAMSTESRVRVWAQSTSAAYVTGGGDRCSLTAYDGATINQDGPEENRLHVRRPELEKEGWA
ncbi:hypothetical protein [Pseudarthrobacter sp. BIM B-2242]|uniref:hypothetical protein n=1 Tax=Pseudarthrobacter sp. BIM B-2242 TaxID=2772401 RepID=UPI00168ABF55|nr:hypothetical protein [Pseudarthrobacter sp. BIM B-2242]QOD06102.1 hypothetical protein IDT60_21315 [Pseudarthrobacter sp. BIM B-2242]